MNTIQQGLYFRVCLGTGDSQGIYSTLEEDYKHHENHRKTAEKYAMRIQISGPNALN